MPRTLAVAWLCLIASAAVSAEETTSAAASTEISKATPPAPPASVAKDTPPADAIQIFMLTNGQWVHGKIVDSQPDFLVVELNDGQRRRLTRGEIRAVTAENSEPAPPSGYWYGWQTLLCDDQ